eukprot:s77_g22.t1
MCLQRERLQLGLGEGVIAFELELANKEAPGRPTSPPIKAQPATADSERALSIAARWQYPCAVKGCGDLLLIPQWEAFHGRVCESWCLEAVAFCVLGEQTCSLPSSEGLQFILDLGETKPRWGQVKVCLTVWDEVVLRTARNAFFGPRNPTPEGRRGCLHWHGLAAKRRCWSCRCCALRVKLVRLPCKRAGNIRWPARRCLILRQLQVSGVGGPSYLIVRVLHQTSRAAEGLHNRSITLRIGIPKPQERAANPARLLVGLADSLPQRALRVATPRASARGSQIRFVVPGSLVKLGRRLRFAGFDTAIVDSIADAAALAAEEGSYTQRLQYP